MRQEIKRTPRIVHNPDAVECAHQDLWNAAQQEIAEHHTQCAMEYYRQRERDNEMHRLAKENGANQL